ncbi:MAG: hypothetical protein FWC27_14280 [Firmicutes bacterium]|nr:hypothetical protein [Bacillota bacterium]
MGYHKNCSMEELFERYLGQPIEVLTNDGVRYCGYALALCGDGVELIDKCNRVIFISLRHVTAIVEPKMHLTPFCGKTDCACKHKDCECGPGDEAEEEEEEEEEPPEEEEEEETEEEAEEEEEEEEEDP